MRASAMGWLKPRSEIKQRSLSYSQTKAATCIFRFSSRFLITSSKKFGRPWAIGISSMNSRRNHSTYCASLMPSWAQRCAWCGFLPFTIRR